MNLDRDFASASDEEADAAGARVWHRLHTASAPEARLNAAQPAPSVRPRSVVLAAAALVVLAAVGTAVWLRPAAPAPYRVVERDVLALLDGSRVEMQPGTDLAVERADDGLRIRLNRGGIIVNAADQRTGHLYVATRDMTVSVVGTVFLVNAGDEGSRVAVIEGEVRVQFGGTALSRSGRQGSVETTLMRGEDLATSASVNAPPVSEAIAWSRNAPALVALLQQSAVVPPAVEAQNPSQARDAFEVVSIRPSGPVISLAPGARGGGGGANSRPSPDGCAFDSMGYSYQLDPRRFAVTRVTVLHLVGYTIPNPKLRPGQEPRRADANCGVLTNTGLLSGGPDWIRTDMWDVVASIPEGVFNTSPSLIDPIVQQMLRAMLAERFKVVIRREPREIPVYLLKVGRDGPKFNGVDPRSTNLDPARGPVLMVTGPDGKATPAKELPPAPDGEIYVIGGFLFGARNVSMANWVDHLFGLDGRPVLDRTGLTGRYDFHYRDQGGRPRAAGVRAVMSSLDRAVISAMGFELEAASAPFDAWVIERVERPSEN